MKVALVVAGFPPSKVAGTEVATYNIARHLSKRGNEVHVITTLYDELPRSNLENGFFIYRIPRSKMKLGVIEFWVKTFSQIKKINPDLVHIQTIWRSVPGYLSWKFLNIPYVVWGQGSDVYIPPKFTFLISKLMLKNAASVIALTNGMKTEMQNIYNREIFVVPNGIELKNFQEIDAQYTQEKAILFVGRLVPVKGVSYLVSSMKKVIDLYPEAKLILIGDGEDKGKLELLVKKLELSHNITFLGKVSNNDIPKYMSDSCIFVLPSLSEGLPVVILEAMAAGLPIVTTNVGGIPDIVKDGINGFLVKPKDIDQLADKILLLLNNEKLRTDISRTNLNLAADYDWSKVTDKLEKIYSLSVK